MTVDTALDCPKCGKKGFIRLHEDNDVFRCIYCKHKADLSEEDKDGKGMMPLAFFTVLVFALLILMT